VVASGVAGFVSTLAAVDSLAAARDRFYAQGHFADVFAGVRRAPGRWRPRLQALPGVADVQTSIEFDVRLSLPGVGDPIIGHLIGLDPRLPLRLNRITLKRGVADDPASMSPGRDAARWCLAGLGVRVVCTGAPVATGRAPVGADQRPRACAGSGGHRPVARVHLCRAVGHA
jgi:hypothetical protein